MNVNDVPSVDRDASTFFATVFAHQRELMARYHEVETKNGTGYARVKLRSDGSIDLHERQAQALLKDFAWRVTEELTEATAALDDDPDHLDHSREEVADALHFLVELCILSRIKEPSWSTANWWDNHDHGWAHTDASGLAAYELVENLGRAMNCLKQKPWKTTHVLTDVARYRGHVVDALKLVPQVALACGIETPEDLLDLYLRKKQVNEFRLRSAY